MDDMQISQQQTTVDHVLFNGTYPRSVSHILAARLKTVNKMRVSAAVGKTATQVRQIKFYNWVNFIG
jgi:hypothetical protein